MPAKQLYSVEPKGAPTERAFVVARSPSSAINTYTLLTNKKPKECEVRSWPQSVWNRLKRNPELHLEQCRWGVMFMGVKLDVKVIDSTRDALYGNWGR
jgi:hypothetical protein